MYQIIGGDGREYGPVDEKLIRQWIVEGRLNLQSKVRPAGSADWKCLGDLPEFGAPGAAPGSLPPFAAYAAPAPLPAMPPSGPKPVYAGDYQLDIGGCIGQGWRVATEKFGIVFPPVLVYVAVLMGLGLLGAIPFIGLLFSLVTWVLAGPLLGGLYLVFLRVLRGEPAGAGDIFAGFQRCFGHLFLGKFITGLFCGLCMLPAVIVGLATCLPSIIRNDREPPVGALIATAVVALICILPVIWLAINWLFTLWLIIDRDLDFWTAMKTSWRQVSRHWFAVFGLALIGSVIYMLGMLLCIVGLFFTGCIFVGTLAAAYETLFRPRATP